MTMSVVPVCDARVRGGVYFDLARFLEYPDVSFVEELASGVVGDRVARILEVLPLDARTSIDPGTMSVCGPEEIEAEYLRLFELPVDGPPVPLYGGVYTGDRRRVMEELVRLYEHFGLTVVQTGGWDLPDAIPTVLEFMGYLCVRESSRGAVAADERRAQRDLLERYLVVWMAEIHRRIRRKHPAPPWSTLVWTTAEFCRSDLARVRAVWGGER